MKQYINKIIQGDCLEIMKEMPDKSVDLVLTSPPYNLGNNHHTGKKKHNPYNDNLPEEEYQRWQIEVLDEAYRITKDNGSILYNHKNRIKNGVQITPYEWLLKTKWIVKQELVWFNRSQNFDKIRFYPMTERIYWLAKSKDTKINNVINHHDLFEWKPVGTKGNHTRAFPVEMAKDLISCFEGDVILDPMCGSGTTLLGAKYLNRKYIGIELSPEYVKIAEERLRQEILI